MATVEAMTQLLTQNAEFFRTMQQQQHQQVQEMINLLQTMSGGGSDRRGEGLQERRFRELGNFSGSEEEWKEFGLQFCVVVKETEPELFKAMRWAEAEDNDISKDSIQGTRSRPDVEVGPQVQCDDTDAGDADHAQGDAPSEDRQEPGCAHTGQQVGEPDQHLGPGLPGEGLGHDEGRPAHPQEARRPAGYHSPTCRPAPGVPLGEGEGRQSRGREGPAARSKCHGCRALRTSRGGRVRPRGG